jgi:hypothetical protein
MKKLVAKPVGWGRLMCILLVSKDLYRFCAFLMLMSFLEFSMVLFRLQQCHDSAQTMFLHAVWTNRKDGSKIR